MKKQKQEKVRFAPVSKLKEPANLVTSTLLVTRGGVPIEDQAQGVQDFKDECRAQAAYARADRWARSTVEEPYGV